jgi:hypothetical protein
MQEDEFITFTHTFLFSPLILLVPFSFTSKVHTRIRNNSANARMAFLIHSPSKFHLVDQCKSRVCNFSRVII